MRYYIRWAVLAFQILATPGYAAYLKKGCGNTRPQAPGGIGGTIHFAVLEPTGGIPGDTWATGFTDIDDRFVPGIDFKGEPSPNLDRGAKYLYLYQFVNNGLYGLPVAHSSIHLLVDPRRITSWGYFRDAGLAQGTAEGGLEAISFSKFFGVPATPAFHSEASIGVHAPAVVDIGGAEDAAVNPDQVTLMAKYFVASWRPNPLETKRRGALFGFTTNLPWTLDEGAIHPPRP